MFKERCLNVYTAEQLIVNKVNSNKLTVTYTNLTSTSLDLVNLNKEFAEKRFSVWLYVLHTACVVSGRLNSEKYDLVLGCLNILEILHVELKQFVD